MARNAVLLATALVVTSAVTAVGVAAGQSPGPQPAAAPLVEPPTAEATAAPAAVQVLRAWDAQRAAAWARGDPERLAALYTPGSVAGRRDRAMLRGWRARGLVVRGLRTQLLAVRELRHSPSTWTVEVTDRLAGGVAVGRGIRQRLPVDKATTRTIVLRRVGGQWRVAAVTTREPPVAQELSESPARTTASTSRSWNS